MGKFKVVAVDKLLPLTHYETDILEAVGATVEQYNCVTPEDIEKVAADADAIMTVGTKITREAISKLKKCKVIGRYGVGIDNIDAEAATEAGIVVTYVPVYCQEEVATLALTLMLACERRIIPANEIVKAGQWKNSLKAAAGARSPKGKTFGLIGFGSIAREVVPLVQPLKVKVIAYDPYINLDLCKKLNVESVELEYLLKNSDYVSIHVPLMPSTYHMIDKDQLSIMKNDAILINTGRGALINQQALCEALKQGNIAAAGIDVLEFEPPDPEDPIFKLNNIITTGHIAAATNEALVRLRQKVAQGVADVLTGKCPEAIGNPAVKQKVNFSN